MDFEAFPKIPRLNRDIVITEKIDGTNAAILIEEVGGNSASWEGTTEFAAGGIVARSTGVYRIQAQSRKRLIQPGKGTDNYGFAGWVRSNAAELVELLGPGRHFGEWWGAGINRGYGFTSQRNFSLFRPGVLSGPVRLSPPDGMTEDATIDTVPVLYQGPFATGAINVVLHNLGQYGSVAAPGFTRPEGIIVWHEAARQLFKVTRENDEAPKGLSQAGGTV